jgi:serine protease Do
MKHLLLFTLLISCASTSPSTTNQTTIFKVEIYNNGIYEGNGTGFVAATDAKNSYIITNKHICHNIDAEYILIDYYDKRYTAKYYRTHNTADLCLLKVDGKIGTTSGFSIPKDNEHITSIGSPHGAFPIVSAGYMRETIQVNSYMSGIHYNFIARYVDLLIEEGDSGSPVFNDGGKVVGVVFGTIDGKQSIIVPSDIVEEFVESVK